MPKNTVILNYEDAKIYRLVFTGTDAVYIGSTCGTLQRRMWHHTHSAKYEETQKQTAACRYIREAAATTIELIEDFPCESKEQLAARERHWIESTPTAINTNIPGQTWQERREKRIDEHKAYMKAYAAERYTCECGREISRAEKARHNKSKNHLAFLEAQTPTISHV